MTADSTEVVLDNNVDQATVDSPPVESEPEQEPEEEVLGIREGPESLAFTGATTQRLAEVGVLLVLVGFFLHLGARRREKQEEEQETRR